MESIAVSPNGLVLAVGDTGNLSLWRVSDGSRQQLFEHFIGSEQLRFSPDNQILATLGVNVELINLSNGNPLRSFEPSKGVLLKTIAYSSDGKSVAISNYDGDIILWNTSDGRVSGRLQKAQKILTDTMEYSPDGQTIAVGHDEGVHLWNLKDGKLQFALSDVGNIVRYSPDSMFIAIGSVIGTIELRRSVDGEPVNKIQAHTKWITGLAWSSDGQILITASYDQTVKLWNMTEYSLLHTIQGQAGAIRAISCSKDGHTIAIHNEDGTVQVWRY